MTEIIASLEEKYDFDEDTMEAPIGCLHYCYLYYAIGNYITAMWAIKTFDEFTPEWDKHRYTATHVFEHVLNSRHIENGYTDMALGAPRTTVKGLKDGGARIFIPITKDFHLFNGGRNMISSNWFRGNTVSIEDFAKKIQSLLGKDFWDIDKGCTLEIPFDRAIFKNGYQGFDKKKFIDEEEEGVDSMLDGIKQIVLVANPAGGQQHARINRKLSKEMSDAEYNEHISYCLGMRKYSIFVGIDFPKETVQYVTQTEEYNPLTLWQYASTNVKAMGETSIDAIMPLENIREHNATRVVPPPKRTNDESVSVDYSGVPVFVPDVDRIDNYKTEVMESAHEDELLGFSLHHPLRSYADHKQVEESGVANRILFHDPYQGALTYIKDNQMQVKRLNKSVKADAHHLHDLMNSRLGNDPNSSKSLWKAFENLCWYAPKYGGFEQAVKIDLNDFELLYDRDDERAAAVFGSATLNSYTRERFPDQLRTYLKNPITFYTVALKAIQTAQNYYDFKEASNDKYEMPKDQRWVINIGHEGILMKHLTPDSEVTMLRPLGVLLKKLSEAMLADPVVAMEMRSVDNGMDALGMAHMFATYIPKMDEITKEAQGFYDANDNSRNPKKDWVAPGLPGGKEGFYYLPHQGGVQQRMATRPEHSILSIAAGGGKTTTALSLIIQEVDEGLSKRPIVICPNFLMSNYAEDLLKLTGGRWNLFPISRSVFMTHSIEDIRAMINKAPPNTIFITDYGFVKGRQYWVAYGTTEIQLSENCEMLKEMGFDRTFVDESQYIKNSSSQTTQFTTELMHLIPRKTVMSGTIVDNTPQDVVSQARACDPTIFGSDEDFIRIHSQYANGDKIVVWKEGALQNMRNRLGKKLKFIQVGKKEWGALLPHRNEHFIKVDLTPQQKSVYDSILKAVIEEIKKNAKLMERLKNGGEDDALDIEGMLNPYLQRLEQYLITPGADPVGEKLLHGDDLISPSIKAIVDLIEQHQKDGKKGKILIFTQYLRSGDTIYDMLPPSIKKHFISYKAASKHQHKARFQNDKNIWGMVGVETSLKEGHNFQNVDMIIRVDAVWTPGALEQSESRMFRPDVGNLDAIKEKDMYWVIPTGTIAVAKAARLMSKTIIKAKFDEADNPLYAGLPEVDLVSMNLDTIAAHNDFDKTLSGHLGAYQEYRAKVKIDYENWKTDPRAMTANFPVKALPSMKGSAIIPNLPYIENGPIPFMGHFNITMLGEYAAKLNEASDTIDMTGVAVHTELGDGIVIKNNKNSIAVRTTAGEKVTVLKLKSFVFDDQEKAKKDFKSSGYKSVRVQTAALMKLPQAEAIQLHSTESEPGEDDDVGTMDFEAPAAKSPTAEKKTSKVKDPIERIEKLHAKPELHLYAKAINNQICIGAHYEDEWDEHSLAEIGFEWTAPFFYAPITSRNKMEAFYERVHKLIDKGVLTLKKEMMEELEHVHDAFQKGKRAAAALERIRTGDLRFWKQLRRRKPQDPNMALLQFMVEDGTLYAAVYTKYAKAGLKLTRSKITGITWNHEEDGESLAYFASKGAAVAFCKQLEENHTIANKDDLKAELKELRVVQPHKEEE